MLSLEVGYWLVHSADGAGGAGEAVMAERAVKEMDVADREIEADGGGMVIGDGLPDPPLDATAPAAEHAPTTIPELREEDIAAFVVPVVTVEGVGILPAEVEVEVEQKIKEMQAADVTPVTAEVGNAMLPSFPVHEKEDAPVLASTDVALGPTQEVPPAIAAKNIITSEHQDATPPPVPAKDIQPTYLCDVPPPVPPKDLPPTPTPAPHARPQQTAPAPRPVSIFQSLYDIPTAAMASIPTAVADATAAVTHSVASIPTAVAEATTAVSHSVYSIPATVAAGAHALAGIPEAIASVPGVLAGMTVGVSGDGGKVAQGVHKAEEKAAKRASWWVWGK